MANASRDGNRIPTLIGTSSTDNVTPINVAVDPVTHRLKVDLTGAVGTGTVTGPVSSTDNAIARWNGTDGTAIQDSAVTVADTTGAFSVPNGFNITSAGTLDLFTGGDGESLRIITSDGTTNNSTGGNITLTTGSASTSGGNAAGGNFSFAAGDGFGSSAGGGFTFTAGSAGATGNGGAVFINAGTGGVTSGTGGEITITGGTSGKTAGNKGGTITIVGGHGASSLNNLDGGDVIIAGGAPTAAGNYGVIAFQQTTNRFKLIYDLSNIGTSDKTITWQNASGTVALNGLSGTKVYYVSDTSGGAVTRKLTFTDGILTSET